MQHNDTEGKRPVTVIFCTTSSFDSPSDDNVVKIAPSKDNWDDFGQRTRVEICFHTKESNNKIYATGLIGIIDPEGKSHGREYLKNLLSNDVDQVPSRDLDIRFFTMLPDMEAYRELVRKIGPDQTKALLLAINDLIAIRDQTPSDKIIDAAEKTEIFSLSFMRNTDTFFAYKNAGMLLNGLENEKKGVLSESLAITFQLAGLNNKHDFVFKFDHKATLPKRISVIIGKNGVGKSQTLGRIARSALKGTNELTDELGDRPLINRLLAFAPTNEAESVFPNDKVKKPLIWYRRFTMNRSRRAKRDDYVSDLVLQVARSPQELAGKSRWALFEDAIGAIANLNQLALTTSESPRKLIPLTQLIRGSEQRLLEKFSSVDLKKEPVRVVSGEDFPLSSGEISFLKFAAQASVPSG